MIDHAQRLLLRDGYQNFNLDELAEAVEYSKGTIYLHFSTKEDLVLAVATRALKERADYFERAAKFNGMSRERARAIGFGCIQFALQHRDFFNVQMMLKSVSFWEKASDERKQTHSVQGARCFHTVNNIAVDAVRAGDLPADRIRPEQATLALFAVTIGTHIAASQADLMTIAAVEDSNELLRAHHDIVCDGLGWKPLTRDWDYAATDRRIQREVFPEATWLR